MTGSVASQEPLGITTAPEIKEGDEEGGRHPHSQSHAAGMPLGSCSSQRTGRGSCLPSPSSQERKPPATAHERRFSHFAKPRRPQAPLPAGKQRVGGRREACGRKTQAGRPAVCWRLEISVFALPG